MGLAFLLPNHYKPWSSYHQELLFFIGFSPFLALLTLPTNIFYKSSPKLVSVILITTILWIILQRYLNIIPYNGDAWLFFLYISIACITIKAFSTQPLQEKDWDLLWLSFIFSGILSWGMMLHQIFNLEIFQIFIIEIKPGNRPYANLAQPNHLATLLLLACIGSIYLYSKNKISLFTCILILVMIGNGIALTQTRTAPLILVTIAGFSFFLRKTFEVRTERKLIILTLTSVILWSFLNPLAYDLIIGQETESTISRPFNAVRIIFIEQSILATLKNPWLGYGFGQIPTAQIETIHSVNATKESFTISFHNIFADIFVWTGIPFGIAIISTLLFSIAHATKSVRKQEDCSAIFGLLAIGTHALFELPVHYAYFLLPACLFLGHLTKSPPSKKIKFELLIYFIFSISLILSTLIGAKIAEEYAFWEKKWEQTNYKILNFQTNSDITPPRHIILDNLEDLDWLRSLDIEKDLNKTDLNRLERTVKRNPGHSELLKYAIALNMSGQKEKALHYLDILCKIYPDRFCKSIEFE